MKNANTFKSERAAKIAYTKAEKAAVAAQQAATDSQWTPDMQRRIQPDEKVETARLRVIEVDAWAHAKAVYLACRAQGFAVYSYHFSENATRDLISQNID